ncbi:MAG: type II secretion system protein [Smithella sp.]|jgi:prepilin-type N-terminal cleavage/methylation domain-containing protein|nr:type II secretion system protein [Smithella sp.]
MIRTTIPKGYTLVELCIVLALLAIMSTLAIPAWKNYSSNINLKTAAREVMSDLLNARQRAIEENINTYRLTFNVANNNYTLSRTDTGITYWTKPLTSYGNGISIQSVNFNNGSTVSFQRRGTVTMGNLVLTNLIGSTATITVQITARTYVQYNM